MPTPVVLPTYDIAYFNTAYYYISEYQYEPPEDFIYTLPINYEEGAESIYSGGTFSLGEASVERSYHATFVRRIDDISSIYKFVLLSYDGQSFNEQVVLDSLGYAYARVEINHSDTSISRIYMYFIPESELPYGLTYDFNNKKPVISDLGLIYQLYNLGLNVSKFFPSMTDLLNHALPGENSLVIFLTSGFLVYVSLAALKWFKGVVDVILDW